MVDTVKEDDASRFNKENALYLCLVLVSKIQLMDIGSIGIVNDTKVKNIASNPNVRCGSNV